MEKVLYLDVVHSSEELKLLCSRCETLNYSINFVGFMTRVSNFYQRFYVSVSFIA